MSQVQRTVFTSAIQQPGSPTIHERENQYVNSVYFVNCVKPPNFEPKTANLISSLTQIFRRPLREDGENAYGCVKQLYLLKKENRKLKTMLSIGGWTWSTNFPAVARSLPSRSRFAKSAVSLMKDWGFDGLDIDWEYPSNSEDAENMVLLLQAVRDELDAYAAAFAPNHHFQLSIAAPAGFEHYSKLQISRLATVVDHLNLMAYDYVSTSTASHNANLYANDHITGATPFNTDDAVRAYIQAGAPSEKLILGIPIYGRSFIGTSGLGELSSGAGLAGSWEDGVWDYKALPKVGATVFFDDKAKASFSYDSSVLELVSFDTPQAVQEKVFYLKRLGLGGSMFWEASGDKGLGSESLIQSSASCLGSLDATENWLHYPDSRYQNIASGMGVGDAESLT
uniref:chitinase n=1 Tax=Fusarium oxysporum (strain Fo5176) TaxID=660025 RepID=A0A0D2YCL5_FUSOF